MGDMPTLHVGMNAARFHGVPDNHRRSSDGRSHEPPGGIRMTRWTRFRIMRRSFPARAVPVSYKLLAFDCIPTFGENSMKQLSVTASSVAMLVLTPLLVAQETPSTPKPHSGDAFLKQFVGQWMTDGKAAPGPGQPEFTAEGTMNARMLGNSWVVSEQSASWVVSEQSTGVMSSTMEAVQTIGYDSKTKKYVGTWVDNMTDYMWKYDGSLDETGKILTLNAEGPNMTSPDKMAMFRDVYEFKSADHIVTVSQMQGDDGKWVTFMTGNMRRQDASTK